MKIAVLGASGGVGRQLVEQAKARGHEVTAVVRSMSYTPPAGVGVKRGDLTSAGLLKEALQGHDAIVSALGLRMPGLAPWSKPEMPDFMTKSTPALVEAAKANGIKRVVVVSSGGVGDSIEAMPGFMKVMIKLTALKTAFAELDAMERAIRASGLDYTIARSTGLTDGPKTGQMKVVTAFKGRATISRADVADWMLAAVEQGTHVGGQPMITEQGA